MTNIERKQVSVEFMLAEFNAVQTNIVRLEGIKSSRVNFFLVIVAASIAGISGLLNNPNLQMFSSYIFAVAALALLVLGIAILNQLVQYSAAIVSLYRRAGRIRRWFADADEAIIRYLAFDAGDDIPAFALNSTYLEFRGGDVIILTINSLSFAVCVISFVMISHPIFYPFALLLGIGLALVAWFVQRNRILAKLRKIEDYTKKDIRFPHKDIEANQTVNLK